MNNQFIVRQAKLSNLMAVVYNYICSHFDSFIYLTSTIGEFWVHLFKNSLAAQNYLSKTACFVVLKQKNDSY